MKQLSLFDDNVIKEIEIDLNPPKRAKLGDIWLLGNHRLMCGDSTDKLTVEMLMNGKKADMVMTDPPYNVDYVGGDRRSLDNQKRLNVKL